MSAPVFLTPAASGAVVGTTVFVDGAEGRHAVSVKRTRVGEVVYLVDGAGTRAIGTVASATTPDRLEVAVTAVEREPAPVPELVLVQALGKGGRDEDAVEAATEIGADGVLAWQSERSVSQWRGPKVDKGLARWDAIVVAATKQSRRARRPDLLGFAEGREILARVRAEIAGGSVVLVLHESATARLSAVPLDGAGRVLVLVGPEGGLSEAELAALVEAGATPVLLGPTVLRTSTAGPAALAVLSARTGRW